MSKFSVKNNLTSIPLAVVIGTLISLVVTILGMIFCTAMINGGNITENTMSIMCPIIWATASFAGAVSSALIAGRQYLITCGLPAVCYFIVLFAVSAMFLDGRYETIGWGILCTSVAALLAIFLFTRKGSVKKTKFKFRPT